MTFGVRRASSEGLGGLENTDEVNAYDVTAKRIGGDYEIIAFEITNRAIDAGDENEELDATAEKMAYGYVPRMLAARKITSEYASATIEIYYAEPPNLPGMSITVNDNITDVQ